VHLLRRRDIGHRHRPDPTTLSLRTAVTIFAVVVGATALAAIAWHVSTRIRAPQAAR
jgi:hypothetical protein